MKRKKCVRRYMARKVWNGAKADLGLALGVSIPFFSIATAAYWLSRAYPFLFGLLLAVGLGVWAMGMIQESKADILKLYREARKECGYDQG